MGIFNFSPTIGVALGGGAARGVTHLGVLKAFEEYGVKIDFLSGNSAGAYVAALYAFGRPIPEIYETIKEISWYKLFNISFTRGGLLSNEHIGCIIRDKIGEAKIEDAKIPLAIVSSNIETGEQYVFRKGSVAKAVMASSCVQGVFAPIEHENMLLTDGGIVENVPISPLKKMGADYIYAINLNGQTSYPRPENFFEVMANAFDIAIDTTTRIQLKKANTVIDFDLSQFDRSNYDKADVLFELGKEKTKTCLRSCNPNQFLFPLKKLFKTRYFS